MKYLEGVILYLGLFLLASDRLWVVLAGIGLLALAGLPRKERRNESEHDRQDDAEKSKREKLSGTAHVPGRF